MHDPTQTPCIVVADDGPSSRAELAHAFAELGYEVLEASDGDEAVRLVTSRPVDLLLCDLQMPALRGRDLAEWVSPFDPDMPVVFMTAFPSYETALASVRAHAADYLEKPFFDLARVVERIEAALARRRETLARRTSAKHVEDQLERVAELKQRFVRGVAHELRTPITVIRSLVSVLARGVHGPLTNEQTEILDHILAESETFAHEIDKLLSLARLENSDFAPELSPTSLSDIVAPLDRPLRFRAVERRVSLGFDVPDRQLAVLADATDISRALHALAENALKFTPEGGHVLVRAVATDDGVLFEVRDDGIGIDEQDHTRIFEPFAQIPGSRSRQNGGCGIGLTYAARIVAAHGARIRLKSRPGLGSSFAFVLPYAPEPLTDSCTMEMVKGARRG